MMDLITAAREPAGAVRHHALALCCANRHAEIGLARKAIFALSAFGRVERDHMIPFRDTRHPAPDIGDDAGTLMPEDRRKEPFGIGPRQGELVGVADPGRLDLDQNFPVFRAV